MTDSPARKDNGTNFLQDNVAPGVTGKIMGAPPAGAMIEAACDYAIIGRAAILAHDFPKRVKADDTYQSPQLPVTAQHLRDEGQAFITYMSGWKGFVAEEGV